MLNPPRRSIGLDWFAKMWARVKTFFPHVLNLLLPGEVTATLTDVLEKIANAVNGTSNQLARLKPYIDTAKKLIDGSIPFEKPVYFLNVCAAKVTKRQPERVHLDPTTLNPIDPARNPSERSSSPAPGPIRCFEGRSSHPGPTATHFSS